LSLLQNVVMADAGDFRCQASNKFASDVTSSTCKMQVRRKLTAFFILILLTIIPIVIKDTNRNIAPSGLNSLSDLRN